MGVAGCAPFEASTHTEASGGDQSERPVRLHAASISVLV
jgi:hypothetical protein